MVSTPAVPPTISLTSVEISPATRPSQSQKQSAIPGFTRRGTSLVAEMRSQDGSLVRLVIDARSHTLIGAKVIEPAPIQP